MELNSNETASQCTGSKDDDKSNGDSHENKRNNDGDKEQSTIAENLSYKPNIKRWQPSMFCHGFGIYTFRLVMICGERVKDFLALNDGQIIYRLDFVGWNGTFS